MKILAIDTEGATSITRYSLSDGTQSLSAPWDAGAATLLNRLIPKYQWIAGHQMVDHDWEMLREAGVDLPRTKVFDTMVAHQCLMPHHRAGLGWSAPLYAPIEPFKHLGSRPRDKEQYALLDAVHCWGMANEQIDQLDAARLEYVFYKVEMSFRWRLADMRREGVWINGPNGRPFKVRPRYALKGVGKGYFSTVTGEVESFDPPIAPHDGSRKRRGAVHLLPEPGQRLVRCSIRNAEATILEYLVGRSIRRPVGMEPAVASAIARGRGPRQFQKDLGLNLGDKKAKALIADFAELNPGWVTLVERLTAQLRGEGFVVNPFGRRAGLGDAREALAFLLASTEMDLLKEYANIVGPSVRAVDGRTLVLSVPENDTKVRALWVRSFTSYSGIEAEVDIDENQGPRGVG